MQSAPKALASSNIFLVRSKATSCLDTKIGPPQHLTLDLKSTTSAPQISDNRSIDVGKTGESQPVISAGRVNRQP